MDTRRIAVAAALLLLVGCRMDPNQLLIERELRLQEDQIYRLRETVRDYQFALDTCRQENARLRQRLGLPEGSPSSGSPIGSPATSLGTEVAPAPVPASPPTVILPSDEGQSPNDATQTLPGSAPPDSISATGHVGAAIGGTGGTSVSLATGQAADPTLDDPLASAPSSLAQGDSAQVARLVLLGTATGGYDADGRPGHEGISVVLQPADQQGRLVEAPADVTVVVLDPAEVGQAARVARWDLPAELTAAAFCRVGNTRAMKLDLTWPGDPPKHSLLHVFVRYTTRDGRNLKADRQIRIQLPSRPDREVAGWSPRRPSESPNSAQASPALAGSNGRPAGAIESRTTQGSTISSSVAAGAASAGAAAGPQLTTPRIARQPAIGASQGSPTSSGTSQASAGSLVATSSASSPKQPSLPRPVWSPYRQ